MIYCRNKGCPHNKECEPFDFQFSTRIEPIYKNMVSTCCSLKSPRFKDTYRIQGDFAYDIADCAWYEGFCEKPCLWNEEGKCTRDNIIVENYIHLEDPLDITPICKCYSRKNISGHMDWSRYPQGGNIEDAYADKLNNEATKFKLFTGSSKSYNKGEHGSKHESRELPSLLQRQVKERELAKLRMEWEDKNRRRGIIY